MQIQEGRLIFTFSTGTEDTKYDEWSFYRNQFNSAFVGTKFDAALERAVNENCQALKFTNAEFEQD